ncbi:DUF3574 domain-containing protein [Ameyamaea chiangmaiensis]|uniref:DUF3574 domain-containing protein n=2 Tax=Ameyamaea chiangmaiensis TaxID=442969 RepID=A0A850P5L7_9PROT|nr:DUF3574 domain-containing protein [Ameyamaea chiangmaiensis]NVN39228.1 DUF3574 domain-containing protein [Ameyamaea chiangmaiensis]
MVLAPVLADCAAPDEAAMTCTRFGTHEQMTATLMFGLSRPDGRPVTDDDWAGFLARSVTPRFPDGLSILAAHGQWRDRTSGLVTGEESRLVQIVTEPTPEVAARLAAIRAEYRARFDQQSVGLVITPGCASF